MFPQALRKGASFLNVNRLVDVKIKCHIPRENNILSCIYFTSFVLQIEKLYDF